MMNNYSDIRQRMQSDTSEHQMTIKHDQDFYRHIHFKNPTSTIYWFDLITWPGALTFSGDMGCYVFHRAYDMFEFFDGPTQSISPDYWGQKLIASSSPHREFSVERYSQLVTDYIEEICTYREINEVNRNTIWKVVKEELLDEVYTDCEAHAALRDFRYGGLEFVDTWEWDLSDFTSQYLWVCWAIKWGIHQYRIWTEKDVFNEC